MESSTSLYIMMESSRKQTKLHVEDYAPVFVVDLIWKRLEQGNFPKMKLSTECNLPVNSNFNGGIREPVEDCFEDEDADLSGFVLSEQCRKYLMGVLRFAEEVHRTFNIDKTNFCVYFTKKIEFPTLELLWLLDKKYHLQEVSSYIMHLEREEQVNHFIMQLVSFCFSPSSFDSQTKSMTTKMLYDFMEVILIASYCNPLGNKPLQALQKRTDEILNKITCKLTSDDISECSYMNQQFLIAIIQEVHVPKSVKCRYFSQQISCHVLHGNEESETTTRLLSSRDVLQQQERFAEPSESPKASFFAMLTGPPQSCPDVMQLLEKSLSSSHRIHWENVLALLTEWIKSREYEAISLVREMIKRLMRTGLSTKSEHDVITAFILARHCSLVAPREFLRYEKWYTNMFESDVYSPAKEPEAFNFLTNLLSQWIPTEPICFLQVHATFWPYIPPGSRNLFADYVSLAKVRIAEYNEVEWAMEFEPNPNNPLQHDVEMAIKAYDNTKKTPPTIGQMWMFRKQHYLENFLPALLKKPPGATLTDARLRLIEVLNREGKIPPDVYSAYKVHNQKNGAADKTAAEQNKRR